MILEIVSPEAKLFSGEVTSVSLPGVNGSFQILNFHAPIVSTLKQGSLKITAPSFKLEKEIENKFKEYEPKFRELSSEIKSLKRAKTKKDIEDLVFEAVKKKIG